MSGVCWAYWKGWGSWSGRIGGGGIVVGLNSACRLGFFVLSDWV